MADWGSANPGARSPRHHGHQQLGGHGVAAGPSMERSSVPLTGFASRADSLAPGGAGLSGSQLGQDFGAAAGNAYNNFAGSASAGGGDGGGWVTVFGFAPELTSAVVAEFRRYGDIVAQQSPPAGTSGGVANWVTLRYATAFSAQKACQDGHCVLLHGSLLVGAVPGRPDSSSSSSGLGGGGDMLLDPGSHSAGGLLQSGGDRTGEGLASGRGAISSFRVVPVNSSSRIRERLSWGAWLWEYALG